MSVVKSSESDVLKISSVSENVESSHRPSNYGDLPLPPHQKKKLNSSKESLEKRAIRNRQYSKENRVRAKTYEAKLKATLQILKDENKFLLSSIAELKALKKRPNTASLDTIFSVDEYYLDDPHDSIPLLSEFTEQDIVQLGGNVVGVGCGLCDSHTTTSDKSVVDKSSVVSAIPAASLKRLKSDK